MGLSSPPMVTSPAPSLKFLTSGFLKFGFRPRASPLDMAFVARTTSRRLALALDSERTIGWTVTVTHARGGGTHHAVTCTRAQRTAPTQGACHSARPRDPDRRRQGRDVRPRSRRLDKARLLARCDLSPLSREL